MSIGPAMPLADFESPFDSICNDIIEVGNTLYESLRPHMRGRWGDCPLSIEFIDSPQLNAIATVDDGQYRICIFRGAVEHIYGAMYGLMSCPSFLPAIGNAKGETPPPFFPESGFCPIPISQAAPLYTGVEIVIPIDPLRQTVAMLLASIASGFSVWQISVKILRFTSSFSVADSITRSHCARSEIFSAGLI